jgi:small-conductance mechanosensitive channel
MELGDPTPGTPNVWVQGRQYTGRIVTVTNDKVFEEPIFNSTRDFPYLFDEIHIPITYAADRHRAERIMLDAAEKVTSTLQREADPYRIRLNELYHLELESLAPRVFYRLTDNWLELTLRFIVSDRHSREAKDQISREIIAGFDEAGIGIASTTIDIVAFPPLRRTETARIRATGTSGNR